MGACVVDHAEESARQVWILGGVSLSGEARCSPQGLSEDRRGRNADSEKSTAYEHGHGLAMDTQALVDELVTAYADILKLTIVVGELAQIDLTALNESRKRERQLHHALQRLRIFGGCWCSRKITDTHSEACDFAHLTLFGVEREKPNGKS